MSSQHEPGIAESRFPARSAADSRRIRQQSVLLFLLCQPGKLAVERVFRAKKCLFAVKDRRVRHGGVIVAVELARP